jgi:hypothetical protein
MTLVFSSSTVGRASSPDAHNPARSGTPCRSDGRVAALHERARSWKYSSTVMAARATTTLEMSAAASELARGRDSDQAGGGTGEHGRYHADHADDCPERLTTACQEAPCG